MLLQLPNELLSFVGECIANIITQPEPLCDFRPVPLDLISLSVVNWRWRQICLPLLFARIKLYGLEAEEFRNFCLRNPLCSRLIKTIHPHMFTPIHQLQKMSRISPAKPYLKQLLHIDISDIEPTFELFHAILEQPTVATVRVCNSTSLPTGSHKLDMSKVVLSCEVLDPIHSQLALDEHLLRGLTVAKVELHKVAFFDERLYGLTGLEEIELMGMNPDSCQGLLDLMSVNPHLRKISLMDKAYGANLSPSFIQSFLDEIHWQSLSQHFRIPQIGLGRHPSQEWRITDLTIVATFASHPLIQVLPAIASFSPPSKSCPWIWGLSARVVWTWMELFLFCVVFTPCARCT